MCWLVTIQQSVCVCVRVVALYWLPFVEDEGGGIWPLTMIPK